MSHKDFTTQPHPIGTIRSALKFFRLVFAISIPFWWLGTLTDLIPRMLPIDFSSDEV